VFVEKLRGSVRLAVIKQTKSVRIALLLYSADVRARLRKGRLGPKIYAATLAFKIHAAISALNLRSLNSARARRSIA
jgi:hypothetical protein